MAQRVTAIFIAIMLAMPLMARVQAASHPDFTAPGNSPTSTCLKTAVGSSAATVGDSADAEVLAGVVVAGLEPPDDGRAMTIRTTRMVSAPRR